MEVLNPPKELAEMGLTFSDSYPKYTNDSIKWATLFMESYILDKELYYILSYLRSVGANLEPTGDSTMPYKITPIIGEENWPSQAEWDKEKRYLVPYVKLLMKALKKI